MKFNLPRPRRARPFPMRRLGLPLLGGLAVAAAVLAPGAAASPTVVPNSCAAFDAKYFHSGLTYGFVPYTLASHTTHTGSAIGVVSYSEGTFRLQPAAGLSGYMESGGFPQYFSNRRYSVPWSGSTKPFDPAATDILSLNLEETTPVPPTTPATLQGVLTLNSWGYTQQKFNVQGCIDDNIIYGTVLTTNGDSLVSIALDKLVAPNQR